VPYLVARSVAPSRDTLSPSAGATRCSTRANASGLVTTDYVQCGWTDGLPVPIGQCSPHDNVNAMVGNTAVNGGAMVECVF
jgi:hypothetical protein